jgi:hypothetical protein
MLQLYIQASSVFCIVYSYSSLFLVSKE